MLKFDVYHEDDKTGRNTISGRIRLSYSKWLGILDQGAEERV